MTREVAELDSILADDFTLTHMTGYVQSKAEWLDAIDTGQMQYHRMETIEATHAVRPFDARKIPNRKKDHHD